MPDLQDGNPPRTSPCEWFRASDNPKAPLNGEDITMTVEVNTSAPKAGTHHAGKPQRTITDRLALLSGLAGAAVLGGEASAAVVSANGTFPLKPPTTPGNTLWDVDGDLTNDFQLTHLVAAVPYGLFSALNGGKQVFGTYTSNQTPVYPNALKKLYTNVGTTVIGPAAQLAALTGNAEVDGQPFARMTRNGQMTVSVAYPGGWTGGGDTGFFGFSFTSGSDTFYGWGEMSISGNGTEPGYGFEITRAYYDNVAGTPISVGAVPVPEPTNIALLAIGAGGLAAWRRRRKAAVVS